MSIFPITHMYIHIHNYYIFTSQKENIEKAITYSSFFGSGTENESTNTSHSTLLRIVASINWSSVCQFLVIILFVIRTI